MKHFIIAFVAAIALSGAQIWAAINISGKFLWQSYIMWKVVGPGPILGYDASGKPLHEGTPVHVVASFIGLFLGVVIYTVIIYLVIRKRGNGSTDS